VIETPLSLPDDIKAKLNLQSRGRGRIWRITPAGPERERVVGPALAKASAASLVKHVENPNLWWRQTAQRLLIERQDKDAVKPLRALLAESKSPAGRAHALWTLHGLKALEDAEVERALGDESAVVREQALRLVEERMGSSERLRKAAADLADDPSPAVRFQLAFTVGAADAPELVAALGKVLRRSADDPWTQSAVLSSAGKGAPALLETLARDKEFTTHASTSRLAFLTRLAAMIGASGGDADLGRVLTVLTGDEGGTWRTAVLEGLGQGLRSSGRPLARLGDQPKLKPFFERAAATARDDKASLADRTAAVRLLGSGPAALAFPPLEELLAPQAAAELQLAAVKALAGQEGPRVAEVLLAGWASHAPAVRREAAEVLFMKPERLKLLLDAVEKKKVLPVHIEPARVEQLRKHPDSEVRRRATALFASQTTPDRKKVVDDYLKALELKADAVRGKMVFKKTCATCHRLENEGVEVGPELLATLRNKSPEQLVSDVMDPSKETDPRYLNYLVTDKAGRTFTGMVAAETATSLTLRRAEKAEDVILRSQIDDVQATTKSVMPEGLEMQLNKQDLADVIAYLQSVAGPR
jgi:putative heme-binding domain-containing protein